MGFLSDVGVALCGESDCLFDGEGGCGNYALLYPSSCINHVAVISIDVILLIMFLLSFMWMLPGARLRLRSSPWAFSRWWLSSSLYNGCLGLGYLVLGLYVLGDELSRSKVVVPLHLWALPVLHGFTWLLICTSIGIRGGLSEGAYLRVWLGVVVTLATFLCLSAILQIALVRVVSLKGILDLLSLPGAIILLLCTLAENRREDINGFGVEPLLTTLNKEPDSVEVDSKDHVTPFATAGFINKLSFWWLNPLMKRGFQKPLEEQDIPRLRNIDQAETCYNLFMEKLNGQIQTPPSIFRAIVDCYWSSILISGVFAFLKILTLSSGPILLKSFIKLAEQEGNSRLESFLLVLALFAAKNLESVAQRQWYFRSRTIGIQIRSLLSAAIYRKQLRLSTASKLVHSSGEIMNYVTVDAYRIGEFPFYMHQTWTTILQLCLALLILYNVLGVATFASLAVIVLTVVCNTPLAKLQHKFQTKLMEAQDKRLKAVAEALVNMKVLKLYAWETHFKGVIEELRKVEVKWLAAFQMRRAYNTLLFWSSPVIVSIATFLACYILRIPLDASSVFTFVATLRLVQDPVRTIPDVIGVVIQANIAFERIVRFLDAPELQNAYMRKKHMDSVEYPLIINYASFSWETNSPRLTLRNLNLEVRHNDKVAICGEVGSGKSSLLAAVLGEIPNTAGTIQVSGRIAYVSQTAWIPTGTIQENILFGAAMDKQRYRETLEKCSLVRDLEVLPFGDLTEIGERGVNLSGGQKQRLQLARALYQDADIYLLDDPFSAVDAHTATSLFNDYVMDALSEKIVLLVTHQVDFLPAFDSILLMSDGEILCAAPYLELMTSSSHFQKLVHAHKETVGSRKLNKDVLCTNSESSREETKWVYADGKENSSKTLGEQLIKKEEREKGDTGFKPYQMYLQQNRGYLYLSIAALSHIIFIIGQISQNSWMAANVQNPQVSQLRLILVYLAIGCSTTIFLVLRSLFIVALGIETSKSLFSQLLTSLFRAPMAFFDSTPIGRILSRVSADLSIVDLDVPFSIMFCTAATLNALSNLGVLAAITWQVMMVSIPMIYFTIKLQRYYLGSAKELMRINGTTKSLVASHLAESVAGAVTIRAFNEEERFFAKYLELIDGNASPFFHNFAATEWLIQRLETLSAIILSTSALLMAFLPRGTLSPGFIGMALSYGLSLNMSVVFSIQNQCILTNYIISVERLNQYMAIPGEAPEILEDSRPGHHWPTVGKVEFQDLKIKYRLDSPFVLHGISCIIEGGYKVGIVGRTGSGKSTLIGAVFRLVEPAGGRIVIDGLDIATIGLHDLRSRLAIIPQDPTLFNGTIRYNLDPLRKHTDQDIWEVLEKCQLHEAVREKQMGLGSLVIEDGSNWSLGQRQLFCLCRALLKKSRIIVLDEATASIDNATDAILQKTIRSEFTDSTVITVAHRIPTVLDCTMVLAISNGKLVEYDEPKRLMNSEKSLFTQLVKEYWSHTVNLESESMLS